MFNFYRGGVGGGSNVPTCPKREWFQIQSSAEHKIEHNQKSNQNVETSQSWHWWKLSLIGDIHPYWEYQNSWCCIKHSFEDQNCNTFDIKGLFFCSISKKIIQWLRITKLKMLLHLMLVNVQAKLAKLITTENVPQLTRSFHWNPWPSAMKLMNNDGILYTAWKQNWKQDSIAASITIVMLMKARFVRSFSWIFDISCLFLSLNSLSLQILIWYTKATSFDTSGIGIVNNLFQENLADVATK